MVQWLAALIRRPGPPMPIRMLPPDVAAKIAAGEVIERPVSVAKELLENAIDAGADEIRIEVAQGGRRLIQVGDNGCGIAADEVELAFARHATSKLRTAEELYAVRTLGFRGEALASICAVSRLILSTRAATEETGTLARLEAGVLLEREPHARSPGTTVQVENLFFNTPARVKFLRSDPTEAGHVARLVSSYALAYPTVRFVLVNNGRLALRSPGTGLAHDVIVALFGLDVAEKMLTLPESENRDGLRISGFVGVPSLHRANRQEMFFFVNRRWVQDNTLTFAVSEAYRTLLPNGRHPMVVLSLELPPEDVDVNVHPTKREVRFRREREVFVAVQRAVRTTVMAHGAIPTIEALASTPGSLESPTAGPLSFWRGHEPTHAWPSGGPPRLGALEWQRTAELPVQGGTSQTVASPGAQFQRLPMLRVVGQVGQTYVVAEGPGGLYLIDQHAAHERIRYENLKRQVQCSELATQELLDPLPLELAPRQAALLDEHLATLTALGMVLLPFGPNTILVKSVPADLRGQDVAAALSELLDAAERGGAEFSWEEQALITLSCHTAVRAGQTLSADEMRDLVRQLEATELPHTCPHGRPTLVLLSQAQLEREFGRR